MLEYRYLTHEDYHTLCQWWRDNRFPIPVRNFLPNNGLGGIMVYKDNVELCAGFIYDTSAKGLAWVEYIVANFEVKDRALRKQALDYLIQSLLNECNKMGKTYIFSSVKNQSLIKHFKQNGFTVGGSNTTEVVKVI